MFRNSYKKLKAILKMRCPNCHKGDFFVHRNAFFPLRKITQIHEKCPQCGLNYTLEPSFYFGAMYVAYALTVGLSLFIFWLGHAFLQWDFIRIFILTGILLLLGIPYTLRFSRCIWIHIFIQYKSKS